MKKFGIFILGVVIGIFLTLGALILFAKVASEDVGPLSGLVFFEKPGECLTKEPIKVFQVLASDAALANERSNSQYNWYYGKVVLIINNKGQTYYDEQVIKPKTCFRQVGTLRYQTSDQSWKTVPAIESD